MREVTARLDERTRQLRDHAFFSWLNDASCPLHQRFAFSPVLVEFIMGFSDMNKWFLSYPDPQTPFHEEINEHTLEDRTHSRWFVEDWIKLDFNGQLGWSAGDTLWWWFLCKETELVRRLAMETLELTVQHEDPLERFAMMQAIEACGDVFFGNTVEIAKQLGRQTGLEYRYYGHFHRARETGHLHADEDLFTTSVLRDDQRRRALHLVNRMFDMFVEELDCLLGYARRATEAPAETRAALEREQRTMRSLPATDREPAPALAETHFEPSQSKLVALYTARSRALSNHPLMAWLREDSGATASQKLRQFVPLWAIDVLGYGDFNRYILRYPEPQTREQQVINAWTEQLASHSSLYWRDWSALGVDEFLRWRPDQVISYYFLGQHTEVHRRNMAKVKIRAVSRPEPIARFWLMSALEAGRDALFDAVLPLAKRSERESGVCLDYWARRRLSASADGGAREALGLFSASTLARESEEPLIEALNTVFDNFEAQFSLSLSVAQSNYFSESAPSAGYASEARLRSDAERSRGRLATGTDE